MQRKQVRARDWAAEIRTAYRQGVAAIFALGDLLIEAKAALPHGCWEDWVDENCDFSAHTAKCYMKIASCTPLREPMHASVLPLAWTTLYELSQVPANVLQDHLANNRIKPDLPRYDAKALRKDSDAKKKGVAGGTGGSAAPLGSDPENAEIDIDALRNAYWEGCRRILTPSQAEAERERNDDFFSGLAAGPRTIQ